ncbi:unnamed protein product, partial [Closterium sp. NIES-53]
VHFTGSFPDQITNLPNLSYLDLSLNTITGPIPYSIGNLDSLTCLYLAFNELTESIPNSIGSMNSLLHLDLRENKLQGSIPSAMYSPGMTRLTHLVGEVLVDAKLEYDAVSHRLLNEERLVA